MPDRRVEIRDMQEDDLDRVYEIEKAGKASPWTWKQLASEMLNRPLSRPRVALVQGRPVGFLMAWFVADEVHIINLVVDPAFQRRGIATKLLEDTLKRAREHGARKIYLEVRQTNRPAIRLYEKLGFFLSGKRPGYYQDTGEDALLMEKPI